MGKPVPWEVVYAFEDALGAVVQSGDEVIYNLSGELARGVIQSAHSREKTHFTTWTEWLIDVRRHDGSISKVRNPNCIVRIESL